MASTAHTDTKYRSNSRVFKPHYFDRPNLKEFSRVAWLVTSLVCFSPPVSLTMPARIDRIIASSPGHGSHLVAVNNDVSLWCVDSCDPMICENNETAWLPFWVWGGLDGNCLPGSIVFSEQFRELNKCKSKIVYWLHIYGIEIVKKTGCKITRESSGWDLIRNTWISVENSRESSVLRNLAC